MQRPGVLLRPGRRLRGRTAPPHRRGQTSCLFPSDGSSALVLPGVGKLGPSENLPPQFLISPYGGGVLPGFVHQVLLAPLRPGLPSALVSGLHDPQGSCPRWNPAGSMARTSQEGEPSGSRLAPALAAHSSITEGWRGPGLGVSAGTRPTPPGRLLASGERVAAGRGGAGAAKVARRPAEHRLFSAVLPHPSQACAVSAASGASTELRVPVLPGEPWVWAGRGPHETPQLGADPGRRVLTARPASRVTGGPVRTG